MTLSPLLCCSETEIGDLIASAMERVGNEGVITVQVSIIGISGMGVSGQPHCGGVCGVQHSAAGRRVYACGTGVESTEAPYRTHISCAFFFFPPCSQSVCIDCRYVDLCSLVPSFESALRELPYVFMTPPAQHQGIMLTHLGVCLLSK